MAKYFRFSSFNKNAKYIFITIFFKILANSIFGIKYNINIKMYEFFKLINTEWQEKISAHSTIHKFFCYIIFLILSGIFYIYETKAAQGDSIIRNTERISNLSAIKLIHNDGNPDLLKKSPQIVLLIISILICAEILMTLYYRIGLRDLDFWMFELLIISYLNSKMFKLKIYKHQKVAIYFNVIICSILKFSSFLISFFQEHSLYYEYAYYIPIGIIYYFMILFLRAYSINKLKWLMDLKYIAPSKILMITGIIGIVMNLIVCLVSTFVKCWNVKFSPNLCRIRDNNYKEKYYESFIIYFHALQNFPTAEIFLEILTILLGSISYFTYYFFFILVIKYLTPVHVSFTNSIYYFFIRIILFINNQFVEGKWESKFKYSKFFIDILCESLSFIGFLIYLEIIELHFCGLYFDLKKYIIRRSIIDIDGNFATDDTTIMEDNQEKDDENLFNDSKKVSELIQKKNNNI